MRVARVVGNVVSTIKVPQLAGYKLLRVRDDDPPTGPEYVAIDAVGAGVGSTVLVTQGTPAAWVGEIEGLPVDAAVVAIVDEAPDERARP
jgi:ethanolamine utilization protein EutN